MGQWFTFRCTGCGHKAVVSGGSDAGMTACTQTILCFDCRKLFDVDMAVLRGEEHPGMELTGETDDLFLGVRMRCPKNPNHRWREWNKPDVCPRCSKPMEIDEAAPMTIWD